MVHVLRTDPLLYIMKSRFLPRFLLKTRQKYNLELIQSLLQCKGQWNQLPGELAKQCITTLVAVCGWKAREPIIRWHSSCGHKEWVLLFSRPLCNRKWLQHFTVGDIGLVVPRAFYFRSICVASSAPKHCALGHGRSNISNLGSALVSSSTGICFFNTTYYM